MTPCTSHGPCLTSPPHWASDSTRLCLWRLPRTHPTKYSSFIPTMGCQPIPGQHREFCSVPAPQQPADINIPSAIWVSAVCQAPAPRCTAPSAFVLPACSCSGNNTSHVCIFGDDPDFDRKFYGDGGIKELLEDALNGSPHLSCPVEVVDARNSSEVPSWVPGPAWPQAYASNRRADLPCSGMFPVSGAGQAGMILLVVAVGRAVRVRVAALQHAFRHSCGRWLVQLSLRPSCLCFVQASSSVCRLASGIGHGRCRMLWRARCRLQLSRGTTRRPWT